MTPYDYRCETCSEIFVARLQMGKEKPLVECPVCGSFVTKRIYISVPALSVKFGASHIGDIGLPTFKRSTRVKRFRHRDEDEKEQML